jgi:hypothetical protein
LGDGAHVVVLVPDAVGFITMTIREFLAPVLAGLIVDRTGSFVVALAVGGIVMAVGAAIYYFMVGAAITDADLVAH